MLAKYPSKVVAMDRKTITVITCAYNEEECISELSRRLVSVFDSFPDYEFEVLIVENGSLDHTLELALEIAQNDSRFRVIELSRNFGFDGGLSAGLPFATGEAVVFMAADLQDPPEVIREFIGFWEQGYENVFGVVASRAGTDWRRRLNSKLFYSLLRRLADHSIPSNARDFRLIDKRIYKQLLAMNENIWFLRGQVAWTGFRSIGVEFDQPPRFGGVSNAPTWPVVEFAVKAIFAHSLTPLRLMPVIGLFLVSGSLLALVTIGATSLFAGVPFPGFGTLTAIILFLFGVLFCLLSVIGIYIALIFEQVRKRPSFVIRDVHGGAEPQK